MQALFSNIFSILFALALALVIGKFILVLKHRGMDIPKFLSSFFRIYKEREILVSADKERIDYMSYNNRINYSLYLILFLVLIMYTLKTYADI
jgi:Na+/glutamate symporter